MRNSSPTIAETLAGFVTGLDYASIPAAELLHAVQRGDYQCIDPENQRIFGGSWLLAPE